MAFTDGGCTVGPRKTRCRNWAVAYAAGKQYRTICRPKPSTENKLLTPEIYVCRTQVYLALEQVIQRAPHSPEAHNLRGLACESRSNFRAAIDAFHVARTLLNLRTAGRPEFSERYFAVSINLARVLCKVGDLTDALP